MTNNSTRTDSLVQLAIQETPAVFALLKEAFAKKHPGADEPTSAEIIASYQSAFESSVAKDEAWLAAHPNKK